VKIIKRLTKGESKIKERNKSHEASNIVVEVGGTSTFVTHDVTKVEVRWAETHLKLKSDAHKERGRLTPQTSAGLSCPGLVPALASPASPGLAMPVQGRARASPAGPGQGQGKAWAGPTGPDPGPSHGHGRGRGSKILSFIFFVFSIFHRFCILVLVFHVVHMYFFETWFSWRFSLFFCSNLRFRNFVQIGSILDFFFDIYFFRLSFFDFLFKIPFTMHNI
jgi:hypothetical protein